MYWKFTVALACAFGVLKKFRLGAPFLTPFLEAEEFKNFTNAQVYGEIYTFWTYSNLLAMLPILVLTDLVRYKPILVLEAVSLVACWLLLVYGTTLWQMQLMQICFGIATASDIAYNAYLYSVVHKKHYKKVTSYLRTASMVGKFLAFCSGQALISTKIGDYLLLNQITLWVSYVLIPIALLLPMPKKQKSKEMIKNCSVEQQQQKEDLLEQNLANDRDKMDDADPENKANANTDHANDEKVPESEVEEGEKNGKNWHLWTKIKTTFFSPYRNRVVFHWSLFTIIISTMVYQVQNYIQTFTLVFCISTTFMALLLYAMVYFGSIFVDYILYIVLYMHYNAFITVASNLIATHLPPSGAYGLVFGINGFVSVLLQALITLLVVDANGLFALTIEAQFVTYSAYFIATSLLLPLLKLSMRRCST
uniref:Folate transporter 1 n=1 Tax=Globodera rostochiensis TaxID=31243 RepID=A0A914HM88_GLORO